jgi:C-terminal processing protease CtpA/Prc
MHSRWWLAALIVVCGVTSLSAQEQRPSTLTSEAQRELTVRIAELLRAEYVFPEVGNRAADALERRASTETSEAARSPAEFATAMTAELNRLTHDRHVRVRYAPEVSGPRMPQELNPSIDNFGVRRVEWLPGRIGYLKLDRFYDAEQSRQAFDAAMRLLAPADAVVIDLRENGGGSDANNLLASYFFADRILFNELRWRKEETEAFWTDPTVQPQLPTMPLFILTSSRTFSAAEAFAYSLQQRKRAIVIGERTAGGANPNRFFPIGPGLALSVSIGTTVNPVSGSNWEGTGVIPDVAVPAAEALDVALKRARTRP